MADATLTAALIKALTDYDSPYSDIGDVIYAQGVKNPYPYRMSTGDAIGTGLAQGLSAGLFQAYGKSREDERNKLVADALAGGITTDAIEQLGADPETRELVPVLQMHKQQQEQELAQRKAERDAKLESTLMGKGVLFDPETRTASVFQPLVNALASQEAAKAEAAARAKFPFQEKLANIRAQNAGSPTSPGAPLDPVNRQFLIDQGVLDENAPEGVNSRSLSYVLRNKNMDLVERRSQRVPYALMEKITSPLATANLVDENLVALEAALGKDPSLLYKKWESLPMGSDAYNALAMLELAGARANKIMEGRINETTLKLYTDLVKSKDLEPLESTIKRAKAFAAALRAEPAMLAEGLEASGRNVSGINQMLQREGAISGGKGAENLSPGQVLKTYRKASKK